MMIETKKSHAEPISPALKHFAGTLAVPHAFQAVMDMPPVMANCFDGPASVRRVPMRTLLSQLI